MISFTINGSCITNRTTTEIWKMFDKLSFMKSLKAFYDSKKQHLSFNEEDNAL